MMMGLRARSDRNLFQVKHMSSAASGARSMPHPPQRPALRQALARARGRTRAGLPGFRDWTQPGIRV
jgi:hypothetical protein